MKKEVENLKNAPGKKSIVIDKNALDELESFKKETQARFLAYFLILIKEGFLTEPFAKKLCDDIFEVRVRTGGQWRALYAYLENNIIVILSAFQKKTQETPKNEIQKAAARLKGYK